MRESLDPIYRILLESLRDNPQEWETKAGRRGVYEHLLVKVKEIWPDMTVCGLSRVASDMMRLYSCAKFSDRTLGNLAPLGIAAIRRQILFKLGVTVSQVSFWSKTNSMLLLMAF